MEQKSNRSDDEIARLHQLRDQFVARRGVDVTKDALEEVANVYRNAWTRGEPVTKAVAEAIGIANSTAGKRSMAASRAGLLEGIGEVR